MILSFALSLAIQTAPTDRDDSRADDIVVTAMRKLEDWRGVLVFESNTPDCRVTKSAGDKDLDAIGCQSMVQCYAEAKPRLLSVSDRKLTRRARRQVRTLANRDLNTCFRETRRAMAIELYKRRDPAGEGPTG